MSPINCHIKGSSCETTDLVKAWRLCTNVAEARHGMSFSLVALLLAMLGVPAYTSIMWRTCLPSCARVRGGRRSSTTATCLFGQQVLPGSGLMRSDARNPWHEEDHMPKNAQHAEVDDPAKF